MIFDQPAYKWEVDRPRYHIRQYLAQFLLAGAIPVAVELFEDNVLRWNEVIGSPFGSIGLQLFNALVILFLGFAAGFIVRNRRRDISPVGGWIWCLPVALLLIAIVWDLTTFHFDWGFIWRGYFFWSHPGADEGPILRDLLTYPAVSSLGYSVGTAVGSRRVARVTLEKPRP
jgi:hypothetical protein